MLDFVLDVIGGWVPATRRGWGCLLAVVVLVLVVVGGIWLAVTIVTAIDHAANH